MLPTNSGRLTRNRLEQVTQVTEKGWKSKRKDLQGRWNSTSDPLCYHAIQGTRHIGVGEIRTVH